MSAGDRLHRLHGGRQEHRARRRPRAGSGDDRDRRADGARARQADHAGFRARTGRRRFRAREAEVVGALLENADGGAIALGGGSVLSERVREALDRHLVVLLEVDAADGLAADRDTDRPLARSEARTSSGCWPSARRSTRSWPTRSCRWSTSEAVGRALPAIQALEATARRDQAALGDEQVRRLPDRGRARHPRAPVVAAGGARFWSAIRTRATTLDGALRPLGRAGRAAGAGRDGEDAGQAVQEVLRRARRDGDDARGPPRRSRRRSGRRHSPASAPTSTSEACRWSRCRPRWSPRSTRPTAARPGSTCPKGKNYAGAYHLPAAVIADIDALDTLPQEELAAGFVEVLEDRAARRRGALGAGADAGEDRSLPSSTTSSSPAPATSAKWSPPTSATTACATSSTSATRSATRSRRRRGYKRYRHGEAVGLGLLAALRALRARTICATRSRRSSGATACRSRLDPDGRGRTRS